MIEGIGNQAVFIRLCVCAREGVKLCYIHGSVFVPDRRRGGNLLYSWLYACARGQVELCYIHGTLCLCREGVEFWLYSWLCACAGGRWNSGYLFAGIIFMYFRIKLESIHVYWYFSSKVSCLIGTFNREEIILNQGKRREVSQLRLGPAQVKLQLRWHIMG